VVIVGYVTDIEPVAGSSPVLQTISIHDPEPHNVGTSSTFSAAQWVNGPWNGAVQYPGTWLDHYVAVIEPPIPKGRIKMKQVRRTGKKLLSAGQALRYARRWIEELELGRQSRYALLSRRNASPGVPLLVREEVGKGSAETVPHYYIVPFSLRDELTERGERLVRVCLLVNAFSGAFEEVTAFGKPIRYLAKNEALAIVASALRLNRQELKAEATLTFQAGDITHIRAYPFWQVKVGKRLMYVDQLGKLYGKFLPSVPGD
jgi:hypothetical protein